MWDTSVGGTISVVLTRLAPSATIPYYGRVNAAQPAVVPAAYSTTISVVLARTAFFTGATPPCTAATITTTRTITSTGTVVSSCLTATASNMTFPGTSFFTANIDTTGTVNVTCTNTSPYHVRLDGGNAAATDPTLRKMTLGANQITYGLYRDAARSLPWGSTDSTNTLDGTGTAASVAHTVYGRIPPQASKPLGTYTDTIVVTISF